jgi:hypothetical protein
MIRKLAVTILVGTLVYWVASGDAWRALDRQNLVTHHRRDCVYAEEGWMLGEYRKCGLVLRTEHLLCTYKPMYQRNSPTDLEPEGSCRTLDVRYHGNLETTVPSLPMSWNCKLKTGSGVNNYIDCEIPK